MMAPGLDGLGNEFKSGATKTNVFRLETLKLGDIAFRHACIFFKPAKNRLLGYPWARPTLAMVAPPLISFNIPII